MKATSNQSTTTEGKLDIDLIEPGPVIDRIKGLDWDQVRSDLDTRGNAILRGILTPEQRRAIAAIYPEDSKFRSRVVMARHGFGQGEYKYFSYPLPDLVAKFRTELYARLVPIANRWNEAMDIATRDPEDHASFIRRCHESGQKKPTPLLLQYEPGDFNCLHQDLYGEHVFPIQVAILLSEPGKDCRGGQFGSTEQRP